MKAVKDIDTGSMDVVVRLGEFRDSVQECDETRASLVAELLQDGDDWYYSITNGGETDIYMLGAEDIVAMRKEGAEDWLLEMAQDDAEGMHGDDYDSDDYFWATPRAR